MAGFATSLVRFGKWTPYWR